MAFCSQIKEQKTLSCLPLASEMYRHSMVLNSTCRGRNKISYLKKFKFVFLRASGALVPGKMAALRAANRWQRACGLLAGFSFPGSLLRFGAQPLTFRKLLTTITLHTVDAPAVRTAAKTVLSWRHRISLWTKWRNFVDLECRTLKYNKIIIKKLYFIAFLVEVSGPWLKKKGLQRFKTHNELEVGTTVFLHNKGFWACSKSVLKRQGL